MGWILVGLGIRLAQDVGAHRAYPRGAKPSVEGELWARAFWVLVCLERQTATALGRPCATQYEESVAICYAPDYPLTRFWPLIQLRRGAPDRVRRRVLGVNGPCTGVQTARWPPLANLVLQLLHPAEQPVGV